MQRQGEGENGALGGGGDFGAAVVFGGTAVEVCEAHAGGGNGGVKAVAVVADGENEIVVCL